MNKLYLKAFLNRYTIRLTRKYIHNKLWLYPLPPKPGTFWRHKLQKDIVIQIISSEEYALKQLQEVIQKNKQTEHASLVRTAVAYDKDDCICYRSLKDESTNFLYDDEEIKNFYDWFEQLDNEEAAMEVLKTI